LPAIAEVLVMILDRSGSMAAACGRKNRLEAAKDAVLALLAARERLGANDSLAIISFDEEAQLVLPITPCASNGDRIRYALASIPVGGGTDLKPPLVLAHGILPPTGRAHIVLLSDGHGGNPTKAAEALKARGAIIETIGVGNDPSEVDEAILKKTASILDGRVLYRFLTVADQVVRYFQSEIANRLVKRGGP
jgi:Mg-chelatase subunit ChlD